jgi:hypothetical protein
MYYESCYGMINTLMKVPCLALMIDRLTNWVTLSDLLN